MRRIVAGAFALVVASASFAGVNAWTQAGPEGGSISKVLMHRTNPDIALATTASGLYRTTNGGASWSRIAGEFRYSLYGLINDPSDPDRFYVFGLEPTRLHVSTDAGATFVPMANLPSVPSLEARLAVSTNQVLYYTTGVRVFRSEDRGQTWTERAALNLPSEWRISVFVANAVDPNTLYAIANPGGPDSTMYVSHDGATTWSRVHDFGSGMRITRLVAHPTISGVLWAPRHDGLWRSTDHGATWGHIEFDLASDVAIDPTDNNVLYAVSYVTYGPSVHRSIDGGTHWTDITGDLKSGATSIAIGGDRLMVGGAGGVSTAAAAGGTWTLRNAGIIATEITNLEIDPTTDRIYAHESLGRVYASTAGAPFTAVNNEQWSSIATTPPPNWPSAIHAQSNTVLAVLSHEIVRSTDGGANWTLIPGYPTNRLDQIWGLKSSRADPLNLIAVGVETLARSTNGGTSWARAMNGLPVGIGIRIVAFSDSDANVVYTAPFRWGDLNSTPQYFGVYRSVDGGSTWAPANGGIETAAIGDIEVDPSNAQTVYAIANDFFNRSTDGGASWTALQRVPSYGQIAIDPRDSQIIYVSGGESTILRSVNGGASFQTIRGSAGLPAWQPTSLLVDSARDVLNVATRGFGIQQIKFEPDLELSLGSPPTSAMVAVPVTHRFFVRNRGLYGARGARLTVQLATGANDVSASVLLSASTQAGTCTTTQVVVECSLSSLEANAVIGVDVTARVQSTGPFTINATLVGNQPDPVASNNSTTHTVEVGTTPVSPPSGGGSGSSRGGGGGSTSLLMIFAGLLLWRMKAQRPRAMRFARSG